MNLEWGLTCSQKPQASSWQSPRGLKARMSLFSVKRSSRRNIRKKVIELEEEEEGEGGGGEEKEDSAPPTLERPSVAANKPVPHSLLSFEVDLESEGPEFKVRKSNHSRRVAKMLEREKRKDARSKSDCRPDSRQHSSGEESEESSAPLLGQRLSEGFIPDAATIHAVRKKRERARQLGVQGTEYMPLEESRKVKTAAGKSRLIREDEHDRSDSDQEEGSTVTFGEREAVSRQMQVLTALETVGSGSEDEETKRWEEEQMSKGVKAAMEPQGKPPPQNPLTVIDQSFLYGSASYPGDPTGYPAVQHPSFPSSAPFQDPHPTHPHIPDKLVPIMVESLKSRLRRHLTELEEMHSGHRQRLDRLETDLETANREIERLEQRSSGAALEYQLFQEMRGYIRDLLSCLTEKIPVIEKLENSMLEVLRQRAELLMERRRQDVKDEAEEVNNNASRHDMATMQQQARQMRAVEREGRRRRRRAKGLNGHQPGSVASTHYEGLSSDDELLETNRLNFISDIEQLSSQAGAVFEDVVEEFWKLSLIKQRFEEWKFGVPASYEQVYVPLFLPKLFAPFVRLQLLQWNPLEAGYCDFEEMGWFEVLMFYGYREGEEVDPSDEDLQLIPHLVDKVLIPRLTDLLRCVWDPLSTSQTRRAVALIRRLADDYPTVSAENVTTQAMFTTILQRLKHAIETDVYIPLFTSKQLENTMSSKYTFYQRQFWSCVKLLGNITLWSGLLAPDTLQEMVLDGLLNRYLVMALQNSPPSHLAIAKTEAILSHLPESWYQEGSVVTRPLQGLTRYLVNLAELLHRASIGSPDLQRQKTRSAIQRVAELLAKMRANSEALAVATEYKLSQLVDTLKS